MQTKKIRTGIIFSLVLAVVVGIGISVFSGLPEMIEALGQFRWEFLPLILGLTLLNYLGRFGKWQYYLSRLQIRLHPGRSLLIFLSGLSMAITPGKVGELLKSYYLQESTGEPIARTAPIIFAERLSDGLAMLFLASFGLMVYQWGVQVLVPLAIAILIGMVILQNQGWMTKLIQLGARIPLVKKIMPVVETLYQSAYLLLQWRPLLIAVSIGIVSWAGECFALYFVFLGLGLPAGNGLLFQSFFILSVSSLIGSASGLPGGLGTADGSAFGLTKALTGATDALSGASTLIIRFCTLWFGLFIGIGAVLLYHLTGKKVSSGVVPQPVPTEEEALSVSPSSRQLHP